MSYNHALIAIDFCANAQKYVTKACEIAKQLGAKTSLIHAHEKDVAASHLFVNQEDYQKKIYSHAKRELDKLVDKNLLPESQWHVVIGVPREAIVTTAKQLGCDLIILGSHGRHGLKRIIGSTTNAVINLAEIDTHVIWAED